MNPSLNIYHISTKRLLAALDIAYRQSKPIRPPKARILAFGMQKSLLKRSKKAHQIAHFRFIRSCLKD